MPKQVTFLLSPQLWKYGLLLIFCVSLLLFAENIVQKQALIPAPEAIFSTIQGEKIILSSLRGKPVIVTFWATDCPSCIKEVSDLIDLYQQFHPKGLEVIAVAMYYDLPSHVVEMTKLKQIPYKVALDLRAQHALAFGKVEFTPTTFLINPRGQVVFRKIGRFDLNDMRQRIQQFL